jgi:hypothetical protein
VEAFYWAIVTILGVGYGDLTPTNESGKLFTIFYCLIGLGLVAKAVDSISSVPILLRERKEEHKIWMRFGTGLTESQLKTVLYNDIVQDLPHFRQDRDQITKADFVLCSLLSLEKIRELDIFFIAEVFDTLDKLNKGVQIWLFYRQ